MSKKEDTNYDICMAWLVANKLNPDNFQIFIHETGSKDSVYKKKIYFVYNKAFARAFVLDTTVAERQLECDFMLEVDDYSPAWVIITKDSRGNDSGLREFKSTILDRYKKAIAELEEKDLKIHNDSNNVSMKINKDAEDFWDLTTGNTAYPPSFLHDPTDE